MKFVLQLLLTLLPVAASAVTVSFTSFDTNDFNVNQPANSITVNTNKFPTPANSRVAFATNAQNSVNANLASNSIYGAFGTASVLSSNNFQFATNFLTQNTRFVDAGFGSDLNDGSVNHPWATMNYAQSNTPAGWTIAAAPGSYMASGTPKITNGAVNYYLAQGFTTPINTPGFVFNACTNAISGMGVLNNIAATSNSIITLTCHTFDMESDGTNNTWFINSVGATLHRIPKNSRYYVNALTITNNYSGTAGPQFPGALMVETAREIYMGNDSIYGYACNMNTNSILSCNYMVFTTPCVFTNQIRLSADRIASFGNITVSNPLGTLYLTRNPVVDGPPNIATATNLVGTYQTP